MARLRTRRQFIGGGAAIGALLAPALLRADRGPAGRTGLAGWDGLATGTTLRIAGFFRPLPGLTDTPATGLLLPCLAQAMPPTSQRILLIDLPHDLRSDAPDVLVLEATGQVLGSAQGAGLTMAPQRIRRLWQLPG